MGRNRLSLQQSKIRAKWLRALFLSLVESEIWCGEQDGSGDRSVVLCCF